MYSKQSSRTPDKVIFDNYSGTKICNKTLSNDAIWHGAFLDTGAQTTGIGLRQAKGYCLFMDVMVKLIKNNGRYRFRNDRQLLLGSIVMRISRMNNIVLTEQLDVVTTNIPFLIVLYLLHKCQMIVNIVKNVLYCLYFRFKVPLARKQGHIYLERQKNQKILYTSSELVELHRNFYYPSTHTLFNFLITATLGNQWTY